VSGEQRPVSRAGSGREYWRSLDELADTPEYRALVEREFPGLAEDLLSPRTRRTFLKVMGASLGIAGLASCRWPKELIMPFASRPEGRIPGVPQQYATVMELGGVAVGLLVTSVDGRPIKIEGNPLHPGSLGAASARHQASVLELYDPDRSKQIVRREGAQAFPQSWDEFLAFASPQFAMLRAEGGRGLAVLTGETSSSTVARLRKRFESVFPAATWYEWEPWSRANEREGLRRALGHGVRAVYRLDEAETVLCLDADPLFEDPDALRHAREFASRRRGDGAMVRLYAAEPAVSLTGAMADHRLAVDPSAVAGVLRTLAAELVRAGLALPTVERAADTSTGDYLAFTQAAARDLLAHLGRGLVIAGPRQPPAVHALAHRINAALGAVGRVVRYVDSGPGGDGAHRGTITELAAAARSGEVRTLVILGGNPAYDAPVELDLPAALASVPTTIRLGLFDDETSRVSRWHVPQAHFLECWGDARAWDGTVSVQQPLIDALYGGKSAIELLALVLGNPSASGYDLVRETVCERMGATGFEPAWRRALHDGVLAGSEFPAAPVQPPADTELAEAASEAPGDTTADGPFTIVFAPDARVHDGRFANNAWLQELPDPLTKITWDNAALLSPASAEKLGVRDGDLVRITSAGRSLEIAAYVMPGQADGVVVLPLGYGRTAAGRVGNGVGFNAYALRTSGALWFAPGATVEKTGRTHQLVCTQDHFAIDRVGFQERGIRIRELIREATLAEYKANPDFAREGQGSERTAPFTSPGLTGEHQWGMSIDLSACIGCNACMVACQAENNIAVVGKDQVRRGREMHWIRVDRYFRGRPESPRLAFQPVACQQCENAPCEQVCPVAATEHSDEGLNEQVYNRCVGTRYCSNNCPYKVRRFNFFNWFLHLPETERMVFNPDVTVRGRGVMEKCTFCIQRIEAVKIAAGNDRRPIRDGEIAPACAQTCPTEAIVFGDLKDPDSRVARLHRHPRAYGILSELATRPRNLYLARLRNPSPDLPEEG